MPWKLYHWEKHPIPIEKEVEWASGTAWTGTENFAPIEVETRYSAIYAISVANRSINCCYIRLTGTNVRVKA
jgi:hypothetical protein